MISYPSHKIQFKKVSIVTLFLVSSIFDSVTKMHIFDPALLDLEVAIAKNVVYFHRNE